MNGSTLKKSVITLAATAAALVCIGGPMAAVAATAAHDQARGAQRGPFGAALRRLDLTAEQKANIEKLTTAAKQSGGAQAHSADGSLLAALGNPGDPKYAVAVATAKTRAAERIQARSDLDAKIHALLTAEQKAQLPKVLADMQGRHQARRDERRSRG